jgi:hypothetical protein
MSGRFASEPFEPTLSPIAEERFVFRADAPVFVPGAEVHGAKKHLLQPPPSYDEALQEELCKIMQARVAADSARKDAARAKTRDRCIGDMRKHLEKIAPVLRLKEECKRESHAARREYISGKLAKDLERLRDYAAARSAAARPAEAAAGAWTPYVEPVD